MDVRERSYFEDLLSRRMRPPYDPLEVARLYRLTDAELKARLTSLGVNIDEQLEFVRRPSIQTLITLLPMMHNRTDEELKRIDLTLEKPAFSGDYEFEIEIVAFSRKVARRIRITYEYTPTWPHYDEDQGEVVHGWPLLRAYPSVSIGAETDGEGQEWRSLFDDDAKAFLDGIFDEALGAIDRNCRAEDAVRRSEAGLA